MGDYVTRDFMKPILAFVKTCPFLGEYYINLDPIGTRRFTVSKPNASALESIGSAMIGEPKIDVHGNMRTNRQANFNLWLLRESNHNVLRTETANFLLNFEQWVEQQQFDQLCPKLSSHEYTKAKEFMWADNGIYFSEWEDKSEASIYLVQLHISYFNTYLKGR